MDNRDLLKLPKIETLDELNRLLLFTERQLDKFILFKDKQYISFRIPKKNSIQKRIINAPKKYLRLTQKIILREILEKVPCSDVATAFVKNKNGLLENATIHKDNLFLLKMDFSNFFQSIKFGKVRDIFMELGYNKIIAGRLAELCTFCRELPQGGICSPCLSNLACLSLDDEINRYCDERNIKYTRYADDLLFSSNEESILRQLIIDISTIVEHQKTSDFDIKINKEKTKFIREPWHKKITGITINNKEIKVSKKLKREIRQELYFSILNNKTELDKLIGQISFVISIEKDFGIKIKNYAKRICEEKHVPQAKIMDTLNKMIR